MNSNYSLSRSELCSQYDATMESRKWVKEIPFISFNPKWKVKVVPPFTGAVIRFVVSFNNREISVYLDCYRTLGTCSHPYWEAYPINDDTARFGMNDVDSLIETINKERGT